MNRESAALSVANERPRVERMISGPGVYICSDCVRVCSTLLDDDYSPPGGGGEDPSARDAAHPPGDQDLYGGYIVGHEEAKVSLVCGSVQPL